MTDFLPDWFVPGFQADVEDTICDYFDWLTAGEVKTFTWLPPGYYDPASGQGTQPTLRVWRQPGKADGQLRTDDSLVQIACITNKRSTTWELVEFVRMMMDDTVIGMLPIPRKDGSTSKILSSREWLGPQQVPEQFIDEKFVPVTFMLRTREARFQPDYRQILMSLPT
jgi:hypothetical protein